MKLRGFVLALISAIFFGIAGIFVKQGYTENFSPVDLLMLQYILAGVILFLMCLILYRKNLRLTGELFKKLLIQGAIGNTLMTVFYYSSFKYLEVSVTTMLLYTYPALIALYSLIFLKERITGIRAFAISGTFLGCILVLNISGSTLRNISLQGISFGLLSAIFYAFMNIYAKKIVEDVPPLVITFYTTVSSLIVLFIFNFNFIQKLPMISSDSIINAGKLAFFCEIIPLTLLYAALRYISPVEVSIISTFEIPAAAFFAFAVMKERLIPIQLIGIALVIFSVIMLQKET